MEKLGNSMMSRLNEFAATLERNHIEDEEFYKVKNKIEASWALTYHNLGRKGKLQIESSKQVGSANDLSVAYSPGVAEPCLAIKADPSKAYDYTTKGHLVGVISNGTAVLGLGNIGALASKPGDFVMG